MSKIWKYSLKAQHKQEVSAPRGTEFLSVQIQDGNICVWAAVDPDRELTSHEIQIVGTGHDCPDAHEVRFLGTVQHHHGLVWHVFVPKVRK